MGLSAELDKVTEDFNFSAYLESVTAVISCANKYIETRAPWTLFKENKLNEISTMLYYLAEVLRITAIAVYPVMPDATANMWKQLGQTGDISKVKYDDLKKWGVITPGTKINKGNPLFPRIDVKKIK